MRAEKGRKKEGAGEIKANAGKEEENFFTSFSNNSHDHA